MSEAANNLDTSLEAEDFDAKQMVEEIGAGELEAPTANVEADYEASKQFSTSAIDDSEEGAKAAEAATAPQFAIPERDESLSNVDSTGLDSTGNPEDYKQMAKAVGPVSEGIGNVSDDLVQKALEKGKAGA